MSARVFHHIAVTCFRTGAPARALRTCLHTLIIAPAEVTCKVCIKTTTATTAAITTLLVCESATRAALLFQEGERRRGVMIGGEGERDRRREREGERERGSIQRERERE